MGKGISSPCIALAMYRPHLRISFVCSQEKGGIWKYHWCLTERDAEQLHQILQTKAEKTSGFKAWVYFCCCHVHLLNFYLLFFCLFSSLPINLPINLPISLFYKVTSISAADMGEACCALQASTQPLFLHTKRDRSTWMHAEAQDVLGSICQSESGGYEHCCCIW